MVDLFEGRHVPRVGWPTSVLPPSGLSASAIEHGSSVTVIVTDDRHDGTARLDLETREVVVQATGRTPQDGSRLRRVALEFVADRNDFDERGGLDVRLPPPSFDEHDPDTWTSMQLLADVTDGDWYPPTPSERSPAAWAAFYDTAHRFNDRHRTEGDEATAQHPTRPLGERSSADPATPDQSTLSEE